MVVRLVPSIHEAMLRTVMDTMIAVRTVSAYLEGDVSEPKFKQLLKTTVDEFLPAEKRLPKQRAR